MHLTEEDLILHYYGERPELGSHLEACESCRAEYVRVQQVLAAVSTAPTPERGAQYETQLWEQLSPRLGPRKGWRGWLAPVRLAVAGAAAAVVLAAFLAGRLSVEPKPAPEPVAASDVRERVLLVALGDHLERSQIVLAELANSPGKGAMDISAEQESAGDLVETNRLYRQTAALAGETSVVGVLDDLERVLLEIARGPSRISERQLEDFRERLESQGILFRIRVIEANLKGVESEL